jgi:hypothetical protein
MKQAKALLSSLEKEISGCNKIWDNLNKLWDDLKG